MRTIRTKIALCMFLLIVLAMAFMLFTVQNSSLEMLRKNEIRYNVEATGRTRYSFYYIFDSVYKTAKLIIENSEVDAALRGQSGASDGAVGNSLSGVLKTFIYPTQAIGAVHIVGVEEGVFFSSIPSVDAGRVRANCEALAAKSSQTVRYMFSGLEQIEYYPGIHRSVIEYVTPVYNVNSRKLLGYVVVDIDYATLEEMFLASSRVNEDKALVVSESGEILFKYPYNITLSSVLEDYPQLLTEEECTFDGEVFGATMLIVSNTIDYTNWRIVRMISLARITQDTQAITRMIPRMAAVFALVSLVLSFLISRMLTRPLMQLAAAFRRAEEGDMSVRVHMRGRDELAKLGEMFNGMMAKLNGYFNRRLELQQKKTDMELEVLETQINPHFLYNTLDSIRWLAVIQNVDNLAQMTGALISLLRYNLSKDGPIVTLRMEIESVVNYMRIQQYRYGVNLELERRLNPETMDMEMPRFILQPLVENCILHAYAKADEIGAIAVESEMRENEWLLRVIDAGCGMLEDASAIETQVPGSTRFKNIGIANIRGRIRLYYGEGYGLRYLPREGGGTIAEINLPLRRRESPMEKQF